MNLKDPALTTLVQQTKSLITVLGMATLAACGPGSGSDRAAEETAEAPAESATHTGADLAHAFQRSPGGALEVSPEDVAALLREDDGPKVRIVDVRSAEELTGELGHIPGIEHVELGRLTEVAESWDPEEPVVLVCRSGRRSARGVEQLEALGMRNVASMTGGMLRWKEHGLPVSPDRANIHDLVPDEAPTRNIVVSVRGKEDAPPLEIEPADVHWVRTASLLSGGSESCVDGRDSHAVVGTPGGDAGELLVAMATVESFGASPMNEREVATLVDDWIEAFGRFYVHSDEHALEHLLETVREDERFKSRGVAPASVAEMEALVRRPPHDMEEALLELLVVSDNVGCGHLRAMIKDPADYRVRAGLPEQVLKAVFRHMWRTPEEVDWVVLEGEHHERAVVVVTLEGEVHPYTKVPAIPPSIEGRQTFVAHPQVTAYLRKQNASFLLERTPSLARRVKREAFVTRMGEIAEAQLDATLSRLANGLPVYDVHVQSRPETAAVPEEQVSAR